MRLPRRALPREPWLVLAPLLVLQWLALLVFAMRVQHNGWLFHQDPDATRYYTTSWLLSCWRIPTAAIGYGWPYLLSPVALIAGPNALAALPAIVLVQALVLLPAALCCVYGIGARIGGRLVGYWTAAAWVIVPYALMPFWDPRYHRTYKEIFLPNPLGLTALPEFPSTVCLLLAAYLVVRAIDSRELPVAALAGLASGFAVALKPSNGIFLAAPLAALALARLWRPLLAFAIAVLPALVAIGIWKHRGAGGPPPLAAGAFAAPPTASIFDSITRYVDLDVQWGMLHQNLDQLREFLGSVRFLEYLPIAGAIAIARRSPPKAALVALWFAAFFFIKGASPHARVDDGSFLRQLEPSFPAYLLLVGAIPLLAPTLGRRLADRFPATLANSPRWRWVLAAAAVVFALVPLIVVATARQQRSATAVSSHGAFVPVDAGFRLSAARGPDGKTLLSWPGRRIHGTGVQYDVFRAPRGRDLSCSSGGGPVDCRLAMHEVGRTGATELLDRPPPGRWAYRVAALADWEHSGQLSGLLLLSPALPAPAP